jgi:hypothetical protein
MLTREPHVLQVFQPDKGGVPAYVANLSHGLRELGWRVSVATPSDHSAAARLVQVAERRVPFDTQTARPRTHAGGKAIRPTALRTGKTSTL